ncbi:MAG: mandelate racemase/muconate lactonizing enzyme family protein [Ilumatobacteraceae bacterium]
MRIARVTGWSIHLPYVEGSYRMAGDRVTTGMDAVVVRVVADDGTVGIGESGTVGVTFDAANAAGQVAGVTTLAPAVLGADPRSPQSVYRRMNAALTGHPYTKSPIDIAVWDLAAREAGVPLWKLLGGDDAEATPIYRPVQGATPADAVAKANDRLAQGYARLQVKVGDDPIVDAQRVLAVRAAVGGDVVIFADANCGFSLSAARRFVRELGTSGAGVFLEQPCATLIDCAHLRDSWAGPMVIDEGITSLAALLEAHRLGIADGVTVKLTRVGGITPAVTIRDVAVQLGIGVTVEDASGCNLADTTFAHMNASTPARWRTHTVDFDSWVTITHVDGPSARDGSFLRPQTDTPGLGLTLREEVLGDPFVDVSA